MHSGRIPDKARKSDVEAGPVHQKWFESKSRFRLANEPSGQRATVLRCAVGRPEYYDGDDTADVSLVVEMPSGLRYLEFSWAESTVPPFDELTPGDTVWFTDSTDGPTLTWNPVLWPKAAAATLISGRWLMKSNAEAVCPLEVVLAAHLETGQPFLARFELANDELALVAFDPTFGLPRALQRLQESSRVPPRSVWASWCVECAEFDMQWPAEDGPALVNRVRWNIVGTRVPPPPSPGASSDPGLRLKRWCDAFVQLSGNFPASARTGRATVPGGLTPEQSEEVRRFLTRLARCEFSSTDEVLAQLRTVGQPSQREAGLGAALTLQNVPALLTELASNPHVLPPTWEGIAERDVAQSLLVLADTWAAYETKADSVAEAAKPPPLGTLRAAPSRVKSAARPGAEEEPVTSPIDLLKKLFGR